MQVVVFLPEGAKQVYDNATDLKSEDGLITFYYQPDAGKRQEPKTKKITTTLPILVEEEVG